MTEHSIPLATFYKGWDVYQRLLVTAIAPLSPEQLALRAAPHLRSIGMLATHIIATRVGWFHFLMGEGSASLASMAQWDEPEEPLRPAAELVAALEVTWQMIQTALQHLTIADLDEIFHDTDENGEEEEEALTRQWIIWHVLEHDLHHGGELSFSLGMHGLTGLDL